MPTPRRRPRHGGRTPDAPRACGAAGGRSASRTTARTRRRSHRHPRGRRDGSSTYSTSMPRDRSEPVRLTRIYTRGGDAGETSLGDGSRVSKLDQRIAAYGTVNELNSLIGVVLAGGLPDSIRPWLGRIQNDLFDVGADLSVPIDVEGRLRTTQAQIDELERLCDELNADLPELRSFVLPGGTETAALLH